MVEIYNKALIDAGADTIIIGEPTASGLSQKTFWEFSGSYLKNIIKNLKRHVTLHICGRTGHLIEEMWLTGCSGISIDSPVDILDALKKTPRDKIVVGNIDPVEVLLKGTPLLVREKTLEILNKTMGFKNYILSTGCDIEPKTPILNIETLIKTVREWR